MVVWNNILLHQKKIFQKRSNESLRYKAVSSKKKIGFSSAYTQFGCFHKFCEFFMNFHNSLRAFVEQLFWPFFRFILALVWLVASEIKIKKSLHYLTSVIKFFVKSKKFKQNWTKPEAWYLLLYKFWLLLPKNNFWRRDWTAACVSILFWYFFLLLISQDPNSLVAQQLV